VTRILLILAAWTLLEATPAPPNLERLNSFAEQYNLYVQRLKEGKQDLEQWGRVLRAWQRVAKGQSAECAVQERHPENPSRIVESSPTR